MKISIIITTCRFDLLKQCIESILKTTDLEKADAEIIVSMNGCEFEAINYIKSLGNRFRFVWVDRRIGLCAATNLASKVCTGEYLVRMDDDVVIHNWGINRWIDMLIKPFENEKVGQNGVWLQTSWGGYVALVGFLTMTRKKIWDQLGGLDTEFDPGGGEDTDYSIRVQQAGYEVLGYTDENGNILFPIWHISYAEYNNNEGIDGPQLAKRNCNTLWKRYGDPTHPEAIERLKVWYEKEIN